MTRPRPSQPSKEAPSTDDLFALFEELLHSSTIRKAKDAKPVVFELGPAEVWRFDPRSSGDLFARLDNRGSYEGALHLRCAPELLMRLFTEARFELSTEDDASFVGDVADLLPIASALEESGTVLGIRTARRPT